MLTEIQANSLILCQMIPFLQVQGAAEAGYLIGYAVLLLDKKNEKKEEKKTFFWYK